MKVDFGERCQFKRQKRRVSVRLGCSKWSSAEFSIDFLSDPRPTRLPPSTAPLPSDIQAFPPLARTNLFASRIRPDAGLPQANARTDVRAPLKGSRRDRQVRPFFFPLHQSSQQPSQRTLPLCPFCSPPQADQAGLDPVTRSPLHFDPPQPCSLPPPLPSSSPPCRLSRLRLASRYPFLARPTNKSSSTSSSPSPSLPAATVRPPFL